MKMKLGAGPIRINRCGLLFLLAGGCLLILYSFGHWGHDNDNKSNNDDSTGSSSGSLQIQMLKDHGKVSLKSLLVASIDVAQRGGKQVVDVRKSAALLQEVVKGKTKEGVKDSATEGDYRSHKIMYYGLRKAFPGVKVISEEHTESPSDLSEVTMPRVQDDEISNSMVGDEIVVADEVVIWIDPLDATKEYTENLVKYVTTMVGVSIKGKPILGVIHRPFEDETFWAVVGHGHSPNFNKAVELFDMNSPLLDLSPDPAAPKKQSTPASPLLRLIVSRSHAGNVANFTKAILGRDTQVISAAGAGYKVLEVIDDKADAYVHVTAIKKWDLCAGYAILTALGGSMTTLNGEPIDFSGETEPLNTNGILAFMKSSPDIEKIKNIRINNNSNGS